MSNLYKTDRPFGFNTRALHHDAPEATTHARAVPTYQSTSFTFEDAGARRQPLGA